MDKPQDKTYDVFQNIDYVSLYKNMEYYTINDGRHIEEIFLVSNSTSTEEELLFSLFLPTVREDFSSILLTNQKVIENYLDLFYTDKITINDLMYDVELLSIHISEALNKLYISYKIN